MKKKQDIAFNENIETERAAYLHTGSIPTFTMRAQLLWLVCAS